MGLKQRWCNIKSSISSCWFKQIFAERCFLIVFLGMQFVSAIGLLISRGDLIYCVIWSASSGATFPDFTETIYQAYRLRSYDLNGIYPAFVYVIFNMLAMLLPKNVDKAIIIAQENKKWGAISCMPAMNILSITCFAIGSILLAMLISKALRRNEMPSTPLLLWCIFTSAPFIYAIDRGNITLFMVPLLMLFCLYYDSDKLTLRCLALFCLSITICFKLYTVIFGVLLLKSPHRIQNITLGVFFTAILFFTPFLLMNGGMSSMGHMVSNILAQSNNAAHWGPAHELSLGNTIRMLSDLFGLPSISPDGLDSKALSLVVVLIAATGSLLATEKWTQILLLSLGIILFPSFSFHYNALYLVVPLVFYLKAQNDTFDNQGMIAIWFAVCLAPILIGPVNLLPNSSFECSLNLGTVIPSITLLLGFVVFSVMGIEQRISLARMNHETRRYPKHANVDKGYHNIGGNNCK